MLVWINGPFGGGKTQTAHELRRRLPGSVICDPEHVGFGLHRALPSNLRTDFQDFPAWRQGVFEVLERVLGGFDGTVIAPMTLVDVGYFDEILGRLGRRGHAVRHVALLADRETVLRRLRQRDVVHTLLAVGGRRGAPRGESFAVANLDRCLSQLSRAEFADHIWTDGLSVAQVADQIADRCDLVLEPDTGGAIRRRVRQTFVSARHIRL